MTEINISEPTAGGLFFPLGNYRVFSFRLSIGQLRLQPLEEFIWT